MLQEGTSRLSYNQMVLDQVFMLILFLLEESNFRTTLVYQGYQSKGRQNRVSSGKGCKISHMTGLVNMKSRLPQFFFLPQIKFLSVHFTLEN